MPFKYNPPTGISCPICEEISKNKPAPIIDSNNGKASSANNFPVHNWYNFVLGYTPAFPNYVLDKENVRNGKIVADPFNGTGTTQVACKFRGIASVGVDANDFFIDVGQAKLNWEIETKKIRRHSEEIYSAVEKLYSQINFGCNGKPLLDLFENGHKISAAEYAQIKRPELLDVRYISDKPFVRAQVIKDVLNEKVKDKKLANFFNLALSSIILPASNIRYGPGFGVIKPKDDIDVLGLFKEKIKRMIFDLEAIPAEKRRVSSKVFLGNSRELENVLEAESIDLMITSPPYPGDHEYTKHTRLELIFMNYVEDMKDFRRIKQRLMRSATTNIYRTDGEFQYVQDIESIRKNTELIDQRLKASNATSGFEKLYTKLVWEYFGGMFLNLRGVLQTLKKGGKIYLLVSDSHAFKMVHIETAKILAEIGMKAGFSEFEIQLWQDKISTSHKYHIPENILILTK
jgi:DNA modification methylase